MRSSLCRVVFDALAYVQSWWPSPWPVAEPVRVAEPVTVADALEHMLSRVQRDEYGGTINNS